MIEKLTPQKFGGTPFQLSPKNGDSGATSPSAIPRLGPRTAAMSSARRLMVESTPSHTEFSRMTILQLPSRSSRLGVCHLPQEAGAQIHKSKPPTEGYLTSGAWVVFPKMSDLPACTLSPPEEIHLKAVQRSCLKQAEKGILGRCKGRQNIGVAGKETLSRCFLGGGSSQ